MARRRVVVFAGRNPNLRVHEDALVPSLKKLKNYETSQIFIKKLKMYIFPLKMMKPHRLFIEKCAGLVGDAHGAQARCGLRGQERELRVHEDALVPHLPLRLRLAAPLHEPRVPVRAGLHVLMRALHIGEEATYPPQHSSTGGGRTAKQERF